MRKFLLSALIVLPVVISLKSISDTFIAGYLAGVLCYALDSYFVEGRRA